MKKIKGALVGCGYFAENHLYAWDELDKAEIIALCDSNEERLHHCGKHFHISSLYTSIDELLDKEALDFIDIATGPESHRPLVEKVASHGLHVICQKPLAPTLDDVDAMLQACRASESLFMVHENFRWQTPLRAFKQYMKSLGKTFFGRIHFRSGFDVYADQPYLAEDDQFIIYDLGVHLLDLARFYFGEIDELYCHTQKVNSDIKGEDSAVIMLKLKSGGTCIIDLSYASHPENECFPQTLVTCEGEHGSLTLGPNYQLTQVTPSGVKKINVPPVEHDWCSEPGLPVQSSVFEIQKHWCDCLLDHHVPETSASDNRKTLELVFLAYQSARTGQVLKVIS